MERLDVLMLPAGEIIHFKGIAVQLTDNIRVLGRRENFSTDSSGLFLKDVAGNEEKIQSTT